MLLSEKLFFSSPTFTIFFTSKPLYNFLHEYLRISIDQDIWWNIRKRYGRGRLTTKTSEFWIINLIPLICLLKREIRNRTKPLFMVFSKKIVLYLRPFVRFIKDFVVNKSDYWLHLLYNLYSDFFWKVIKSLKHDQ